MPAKPGHPVPCIRLDENGNPLPCPHEDFTITCEDDARHPGTHYRIAKCNLCPRTLMTAQQGPAPTEEE